jgi:hypothetical protein
LIPEFSFLKVFCWSWDGSSIIQTTAPLSLYSIILSFMRQGRKTKANLKEKNFRCFHISKVSLQECFIGKVPSPKQLVQPPTISCSTNTTEKCSLLGLARHNTAAPFLIQIKIYPGLRWGAAVLCRAKPKSEHFSVVLVEQLMVGGWTNCLGEGTFPMKHSCSETLEMWKHLKFFSFKFAFVFLPCLMNDRMIE